MTHDEYVISGALRRVVVVKHYGPGSGFEGHAGRPGKVGGSLPENDWRLHGFSAEEFTKDPNLPMEQMPELGKDMSIVYSNRGNKAQWIARVGAALERFRNATGIAPQGITITDHLPWMLWHGEPYEALANMQGAEAEEIADTLGRGGFSMARGAYLPQGGPVIYIAPLGKKEEGFDEETLGHELSHWLVMTAAPTAVDTPIIPDDPYVRSMSDRYPPSQMQGEYLADLVETLTRRGGDYERWGYRLHHDPMSSDDVRRRGILMDTVRRNLVLRTAKEQPGLLVLVLMGDEIVPVPEAELDDLPKGAIINPLYLWWKEHFQPKVELDLDAKAFGWEAEDIAVQGEPEDGIFAVVEEVQKPKGTWREFGGQEAAPVPEGESAEVETPAESEVKSAFETIMKAIFRRAPVERHFGPGTHPGTGTDQTVHGGDGATVGKEALKSGEVSYDARRRGWEAELTRQYGIADIESGIWIGPSGKTLAPLEDHQKTALELVRPGFAVNPTIPFSGGRVPWEATQEVVAGGLVRYNLDEGEVYFDTPTREHITDEQYAKMAAIVTWASRVFGGPANVTIEVRRDRRSPIDENIDDIRADAAYEFLGLDPADLGELHIARGGPGSGHFGHEGRPGEVGGSLPSGEVAEEARPARDIWIGVRADAIPVGTDDVEIPGNLRMTPSGSPIRGRVMSPDDPRIGERVYHMTTALDAVSQAGELSARGVGGLGGDKTDQIVSMTVSRQVGEQLVRDMRMMAEIADEFADLQPRHEWNEATKAWDTLDRRTGEPIDPRTWSGPLLTRLGEYAPQYGFQFGPVELETYYGNNGITGMHYNMREWAAQFFQLRDRYTGVRNPLFFSDTETLAAVDASQIGLVSIPRENLRTGALLTDFDLGKNFLEEVRLYGDLPLDGAEFIRDIPPATPTPRPSEAQ